MMWGYYAGWNWLWMGSMMLPFWGGLIVLVIWGVRSLSEPRRSGDPAIETLRRRLAAGEISQDEFDKTKGILQG